MIILIIVTVPSGETVKCQKIHRDVIIKIGDHDFKANLVEFPLPYFDVILGMDWLGNYRARIDY